MLSSLWRKYLNKPKLENAVSENAEVGYTQYGPTLALAGSLTALGQFVLVKNICIDLFGKEDKSHRFMDWFAFRPVQIKMGEFAGVDIRTASKLTVIPQQPYQYNILFADNVYYAQMNPIIKAIKNGWDAALARALKSDPNLDPKIIFSEFSKLGMITEAADRLKNMSYWQPQEYSVLLRVTTDNPKQVFETRKTFSLTPHDSQALAQNALQIVVDLCKQLRPSYCYAIPLLR